MSPLRAPVAAIILAGLTLLAIGGCEARSAPAPQPAPPPAPQPAPPQPAPPAATPEVIALEDLRAGPLFPAHAADPPPTRPCSPRTPPTGPYVRCWPNGSLALSGARRRGRRHGAFEWYDASGALLQRGSYADGRPVGTWTEHAGAADAGSPRERSFPAPSLPARLWLGGPGCGTDPSPFLLTQPAALHVRVALERYAPQLRRALSPGAVFGGRRRRTRGEDPEAAIAALSAARTPSALALLRGLASRLIAAALEDPDRVRCDDPQTPSCYANGIIRELLTTLGAAGDAELAPRVLAWVRAGNSDGGYFRNVTLARPSLAAPYGPRLLDAYRGSDETNRFAIRFSLASMVRLPPDAGDDFASQVAPLVAWLREIERVEGRESDAYRSVLYDIGERAFETGESATGLVLLQSLVDGASDATAARAQRRLEEVLGPR